MPNNRIFFNSSPNPTIGVELELQTVDKNTFELVSGAPQILNKFENDPRIKEELLNSILEINTNICKNTDEVRNDLRDTLIKVLKCSDENNLGILSLFC